MARPIRWYPPGVRFYDVVCKCSDDQMLMRPDPMCVFLLALALLHARERQPQVHIAALGMVSNHPHMVLMVRSDADGPRVSKFMKAFDQFVAEKLNRLRDRHGHFFQGRPSIEPIFDEEHVLARMAYAHAQPVHHGLVESVEGWPGLSSFRAVCDGADGIEVRCPDREACLALLGRRARKRGLSDTITIPIATPLFWQELSPEAQREARAAHEATVLGREREKALEREAEPLSCPLPEGEHYTTIEPRSRPSKPPTRKPRPWGHGSAEARQQYREAYAQMLASYREASERFRSSGILCPFPAGTFPPWIDQAREHC